jgi:hypothetical protein
MRISNIICMRKLSKKNLILLLIIIVIVILLGFTGNSIDDDEEWYKHPEAYFKEVTCQHDEYTQQLFIKLTEKISDVFEKLNLKYFLCYGSLWGALKFKSTLPWDRNIDMCIIQNQLILINEQTLYQAFKQNDLKYYYNSRRGKYVVSYKTVSGEITVFEKIGSHMERVGWEKRLVPHLYLNYQRFPYQLIEGELPKIKFNNRLLPVPKQEFEIQKYLYPDNWWKEVKPKGCL